MSLLDIYPTLVDLCGLPTKDGLGGGEPGAAAQGPDGGVGPPAVTTHGRNNHAVRTEKWRYIRYADGGEELYDHDADPLEWKNLAKDGRFADVKAELAKRLPVTNAPDAPRRKEKD